MLNAGLSLELLSHNGGAAALLLTELCSQKVFCIQWLSHKCSHTRFNSYINAHAQAVNEHPEKRSRRIALMRFTLPREVQRSVV